MPPELQHFIDAAGITNDMPYSTKKRELDKYEEGLIKLGYERILKVCEKNDIVPIWLFVPRTLGHLSDVEGKVENEEEFRHWASIGREMGFEHMWSLIGAFDEFEDVSEIQLAEWDTHPNVKGHELLGDKFYDVLLEHVELIDGVE